MQHVYVTDEDRLYSFAPSSVVTIDAPRPTPTPMQQQHGGGLQLRVVEGEPIFYAGIALTNLCNLTCRHCPISVTTLGTARTEWSVAAFTRLIDDLVEHGLTRGSITGGEPFMHPHLPELFAVLNRHGIESKINTNGLVADPDLVAQLVDRGLIEIDVSINDPDDDSGSYSRPANHAADRLAAVGRWRLREMLPSQAHSLTGGVVAAPDEATAALTAFAARPRRLLVYGYLIDAVRGVPAGRRCRNLERHYVYVSHDGQCWWMSGLAGAPLGDVATDGVAAIAARFRDHRATMEPPAWCVTCPARFICSESPEGQPIVGTG